MQDTTLCDAYKQQNPECFACIDSSDTDQTWGPVVRFANRSYREGNNSGCLANALGETGDAGCGAAYGAYEDCRRIACRGCLPITSQAAYEALDRCGLKQEISKICAAPVADTVVLLSDTHARCTTHLLRVVRKRDAAITRKLTKWLGP